MDSNLRCKCKGSGVRQIAVCTALAETRQYKHIIASCCNPQWTALCWLGLGWLALAGQADAGRGNNCAAGAPWLRYSKWFMQAVIARLQEGPTQYISCDYVNKETKLPRSRSTFDFLFCSNKMAGPHQGPVIWSIYSVLQHEVFIRCHGKPLIGSGRFHISARSCAPPSHFFGKQF